MNNDYYLQEGIRKARSKAHTFANQPHPAEPQQDANGLYVISYEFLNRNQLLQLWANYKGLFLSKMSNDYAYLMPKEEAKALGFI